MRWVHPFTCLLAGASGSGKSVFIARFLRHIDVMCDTHFDRIVLYYTEYQSDYRKLGSHIILREGLPTDGDDAGFVRPRLYILDDLMIEGSGSTVISNLFTRGSHHRNLSVFFVTQNLFHQGRSSRAISLNSSYIVLMKNPREKAQALYLARQVCPENQKFFQQAYEDATRNPHSYLLLDLKQTTSENCRFRTNIFPDDESHVVYVPNSRK